jgi:hypothetical protein
LGKTQFWGKLPPPTYNSWGKHNSGIIIYHFIFLIPLRYERSYFLVNIYPFSLLHIISILTDLLENIERNLERE